MAAPSDISETLKKRLPARLRHRFEARQCLKAFVDWTQRRSPDRWVYRGHADARWALKPSAGRLERYQPEQELRSFEEFKRLAPEYLRDRAVSSDWDWLAISQHHGLPTRLLDWSANPLVAAYFACAETPRTDAKIICVDAAAIGLYDPQELSSVDPFKIDEVRFFRPSAVASRITAQKGLFSIHPEPEKAWRLVKNVDRFEIPKHLKAEFKRALFAIGIDGASLMADLDGVAETLSWRLRTGVLGI